MVKCVDLVVEDVVKKVMDDKFLGGKEVVFGLKEDGVGIVLL